jgi:hypothetical protein
MKIRARKLIIWGFILVSAVLTGAVTFAYSYVTDSDTLAKLIRDQAPRFLPTSLLLVDRVQVRPFVGEVTLSQIQLWQKVNRKAFLTAQLPWINIRHDLRALWHGRFEPREIIVTHMTLQLRRRDDGTWNVQDRLADPWPGPPLEVEPTITIKNGTVKLIEADPENPSVILRDVALKIESAGNHMMKLEGSAKGDNFDTLRIEGTIDGRTGRLELTKGDLTRLSINETLRRRLPPEARKTFDQAKLSGGEMDLGLKRLVIEGGRANMSTYVGSVHLRESTWSLPELPFALDDVSAIAKVEKGEIRVEHAEGRNGKTLVTAWGVLSAAAPETGPMDLRIDVVDLELDGRLKQATPPEFAAIWDEYKPRGWVNLALHLRRKNAGEAPKFGLTVDAQDVAMTYHMFKYKLEHIRGMGEWRGSRITLDARTIVGDGLVTVKGTIDNPGPDCKVALDFTGEAMPVDDTLMKAMPPDVRAVVDQFHPSGTVRGTAQLRRRPPPRPGAPADITIVMKLDLNDRCSMRWDGMPYPIQDLTGHLEIYPDHWTFDRVRGRNGEAIIEADGRVDQVAPGVFKSLIHLQADGIRFDPQLRAALPKQWRDSWDTLKPSGSSRVNAKIEAEPGQEPHYHLRIEPGPDTRVELSLTPVPGSAGFAPGALGVIQLPPMENIQGEFLFDDGIVTMNGVNFVFREAPVKFKNGTVTMSDSGKFLLKVTDLEVNKLRLDASLRSIMPPVMGHFAQRLDDGRTFGIHTGLAIGWSGRKGDPARVEWADATIVFNGNTIETGLPLRNLQGQADHLQGWSDGREIELHGQINLDSVELLDQQVTGLKAGVDVAENLAKISEIRGTILGGEVSGDAEISLDDSPFYKANLQVANASLAEYARTLHGHQDLQGKISANLEFQGQGTSMRNLQGNGHATMTEGNLGQLPIVLRLVKLSNRRPATKAAFDSADVGISIETGRATLSPIKFTGDAFSLQGSGTLDLGGDQEMDLRLVPLYGRDEWHVPLLSDMVREASGQLFDIHVFGPIGSPSIRTEPLPDVMPRASQAVKKLRLKPTRVR